MKAAVASTEELQQERYALFKAGLSPVDWMQMTRWQRGDLLLRHRAEAQEKARQIKQDGLGGAVSALLARVLGV